MVKHLPKTVRLCHLTHTVEMAEPDVVEGALGRYHGNDCKIEINKRQAPNLKISSLVHECLHGIIFQGGLRNALGLDYRQEEIIVLNLETHLVSFIRDNPRFIKMIMELE